MSNEKLKNMIIFLLLVFAITVTAVAINESHKKTPVENIKDAVEGIGDSIEDATDQ